MLNSPQTEAGGKKSLAKPARAPMKFLLFAAVGMSLVAGAWFWIVHGAGNTSTYETHSIGFGVVERTISATGPVKALVTVDVGSQLSGLIAEMKANYNDRVKEGDLLAVIDRGPFEAAYASAAANLTIAKADIGLREATVAKAQHQLVQYDRDAGRYRILAPSGSTSRMQLDQAESSGHHKG
ncbi:MAG TPA: biotin/lipoyl-binding protein [Methylocella sp.]|nr:biotin/lipoyl-binding protein [Methylocella sp.]